MLPYYLLFNKIDQAPPLRLNRLQKAFFVALSVAKIGICFESAHKNICIFRDGVQKSLPKRRRRR